jgi:hypothetical protein
MVKAPTNKLPPTPKRREGNKERRRMKNKIEGIKIRKDIETTINMRIVKLM